MYVELDQPTYLFHQPRNPRDFTLKLKNPRYNVLFNIEVVLYYM